MSTFITVFFNEMSSNINTCIARCIREIVLVLQQKTFYFYYEGVQINPQAF
jgi:hypothetical protein